MWWIGDPDIRDFKQRGLDDIEAQIRHANFAPEKDRKARRWVASEKQKYPRRMFYLAIVAAAITLFGIFYKDGSPRPFDGVEKGLGSPPAVDKGPAGEDHTHQSDSKR